MLITGRDGDSYFECDACGENSVPHWNMEMVDDFANDQGFKEIAIDLGVETISRTYCRECLRERKAPVVLELGGVRA